MRRRDLLRSGLAAGAIPWLGGGTAAARQASDDAPPGAAPGGFAATVLANGDANFQALFALGAAGYGAAEFGEVTTAIDAARAGGGGRPRRPTRSGSSACASRRSGTRPASAATR